MDEKHNETAKYGSVSDQATGIVDKTTKMNSSPGKWVKLAALAFGNFCVGACISLQAPFFPAEAESKGASSTEYGFIFGVFQLTIFLTAPIMGRLVTYISPKYLLNFGVVTVGTSCVFFGTLDLINDSTTFVALAFAIRIVEGVGSAAFKTSSYTIVASQFSEGLGKAFAILQTFTGLGIITGPTVGGALHDAILETFLGVGIIIGPTLGGALHDVGGYGLPFYVIGSVLLIDAIAIFFLFPKVETSKIQEKGNIKKFFLHPTTIIFSLSTFSCYNYIGFNQATLEPHLRQFHLTGLLLGFMFSLCGILYAITSPGFGWLTDKKFCDNEFLSFLGCIFIVISILLIGPAPFLPLKSDLWFVVIALALSGIGYGAKLVSAFTGMLKGATNRGFPAELSTYGLVSSTITSSQSLGACAGPSFGGYLLEKYGFRNASMYQLLQEIVLITLLIISIARSKLCRTTAKLSLSEETDISAKTEPIIFEKYLEKVEICCLKKGDS